ncbi:MAG: transcription-repair coupling factor [Candidatus Eremiobacteraeota bacterium]|nr:transcription-repair coupling factor [Candidatus Eremiobacteraeota bacterium]
MTVRERPATRAAGAPLLGAWAQAERPRDRLLRILNGIAQCTAIHETIAAARPYLLAAIKAAIGRQILAVVSTSDAAERLFADLLYYLDDEGAPEVVALLRARDESVGALESPSERSARMTLLADLALGKPRFVVAPLAAVRQYFMPRTTFEALLFAIESGAEIGWDRTQKRLFELGYHRADVVSAAGEYAVRGGILDVFAGNAPAPMRIEFFGDRVESIREFDLQSQRSRTEIERAAIAPWSEIPRDPALQERIAERFRTSPQLEAAFNLFVQRGEEMPEAWTPLAHVRSDTIFEYLAPDAVVAVDEPSTLAAIERALQEEREREAQLLFANEPTGEPDDGAPEIAEALLAEVTAPHPTLEQLGERLRERHVLALMGAIETPADCAWLPPQRDTIVIEARPIDHFNRQIELLLSAVRDWTARGDRVVFVTSGAARTGDILEGGGLDVTRGLRRFTAEDESPPEIFVAHGSIESGFWLPDAHLRVLGDREVYGAPPKRVKIRAVKEGVPITVADLHVGDFVVHAVHGVGQYLGLRAETFLGATQDYLDLRYAGTDRLLVPVTQMHYVTKYTASEGVAPRLSRMGGADWARTKGRVSEALAKIADNLVSLYAERELLPGHTYPPDTPWQNELEQAFPYEETPDQLKAIIETKADMERSRPMDRLICGDVGYGKTEVAIRAAFKAIADQRQVALLVPTTLLASQHYRTFSERLAGFPVRVEELSRFKSRREQQTILKDLADGKVDIVIGTHRLLQKDVTFKDLGLIIVDEEQRFGVMHKERLKTMRSSVDVLTLSATPIPRTLHMSLLGMRDLSLIQTAPLNRLSIKTVVVPAGDAIVQRAVDAELDRGGQVYYLHNRIETIYAAARALQELVPKARIAVAHGQMRESEIEPIMAKFIEGEIDVLVSTTIIENGIDIPNVNTIVVADADRFGLAQLYQLRGRVGRSNHQAYAFLLYQPHKALTQDAKARLEAIREFTHLGSGLQVAMRDLEIRGAGNLLGAAQSGFIGAVGFDTYCQLLGEAIAERRGQAQDLDRREPVIDVKIDAFIPSDYISQPAQKVAVYQQLASAKTEAQVEEIVAGVRDRYGALPLPLRNLVEITKLRTIALAKHVTRVVVDDHRLTLGVGTKFNLQPAAISKFQSLTRNRFRFSNGKVLVDLPPSRPKAESGKEARWMPLLRGLLEAM